MTRLFALVLAALVLAGPLASDVALAQNRQAPGSQAQSAQGDQASARQELQAGRNMPIRDIERRIIPQRQGEEYLGFEYDRAAGAYRLKFIRDGRLIFVDVDARTARVLRVTR